MEQPHKVEFHIPADLVAKAQAKGIGLPALLAMLAKYGPLFVQILTELLSHIPQPAPTPNKP